MLGGENYNYMAEYTHGNITRQGIVLSVVDNCACHKNISRDTNLNTIGTLSWYVLLLR